MKTNFFKISHKVHNITIKKCLNKKFEWSILPITNLKHDYDIFITSGIFQNIFLNCNVIIDTILNIIKFQTYIYHSTK